MVKLTIVLSALFPNTDPRLDYVVRDDGDGDYIAEWNLSQPQPTVEKMEAASEMAMLQYAEKAKIKAAETTIQAHLDAAAIAKGYDNILTASSYAALPEGAPFQAEGAALNVWRAACWYRAYQLLAEVQAGTRPELAGADLIAELPTLELP